MSNIERTLIWILLIAAIAVGSYFTIQVREENKELRNALYRVHQNQDQLNVNFQQFTQATEQRLSRQSAEMQSISSQLGGFRATKDSESGAVVWE